MSDLWPIEWLPTAWIVGWTLVHFLWQAGLIAVLAVATLGLLDRRSASTRYLVCCATLALMIAAPIVTWRGRSAADRGVTVEDRPAYRVPRR